MSNKQELNHALTRRAFLRAAGVTGVGALLAACAPAPAAAPTSAPAEC